MISIGVIGCGHWGPNHVRIFQGLAETQVVMCADQDAGRLEAIQSLYPAIRTTTDYQDVLRDASIDMVVIASPTNTHYAFAREALEHGKHVLCEKPLTLLPEECLTLHDLAQRQKRMLMVGHVFVFNRGITRLKTYLDEGELGSVQYAHSERTNLGPFRYDVNALWDLAPHDISIFNYLFDCAPIHVSARGHKCLGPTLEDLAFASLEYPNNILVNVHVSWLDPRKVRQITVVGDQKMALWDDLDALGPVRLYDKHVERTATFYETYGEFQLLSREGSITIPNIGFVEPLKAQAKYFVDCLMQNKNPDRSDALKSYDVVRTLCAVQQSIEQGGAPVTLAEREA